MKILSIGNQQQNFNLKSRLNLQTQQQNVSFKAIIIKDPSVLRVLKKTKKLYALSNIVKKGPILTNKYGCKHNVCEFLTSTEIKNYSKHKDIYLTQRDRNKLKKVKDCYDLKSFLYKILATAKDKTKTKLTRNFKLVPTSDNHEPQLKFVRSA